MHAANSNTDLDMINFSQLCDSGLNSLAKIPRELVKLHCDTVVYQLGYLGSPRKRFCQARHSCNDSFSGRACGTTFVKPSRLRSLEARAVQSRDRPAEARHGRSPVALRKQANAATKNGSGHRECSAGILAMAKLEWFDHKVCP